MWLGAMTAGVKAVIGQFGALIAVFGGMAGQSEKWLRGLEKWLRGLGERSGNRKNGCALWGNDRAL